MNRGKKKGRGFVVKSPAPEKGRYGKDGASAGPTLSLHLRDERPMKGPGTRRGWDKPKRPPVGVVDTGAGPTTILTRGDDLRMNHVHSLRMDMSTWQMWHP